MPEALGRARIVLREVMAGLFEIIERARAPDDLHRLFSFPRFWLGALVLGVPGFDPADDFFVRPAGSARPCLGKRRLDARHLPRVHLDIGSDGLAGEIGFAALGVARQSLQLVAEFRGQPQSSSWFSA